MILPASQTALVRLHVDRESLFPPFELWTIFAMYGSIGGKGET
jgi:hypothetical protein